MNEFAAFGDPSRFEIAIRWTGDSEARARLPAAHGWSMGALRITIGGQVVTKSRRGAATQSHVAWYLSPFLSWVACNWIPLLHEEDFGWSEKTSAPAVVACHRAMERWIAVEDDAGKTQYRRAQSWYRRHALRTSSEGGLFPDLFIRRFGDDVELSWTGETPFFAPDGFIFTTEPGLARLSVSDVGTPLWEALTWAASTAPRNLSEDDRGRHGKVAQEIEQIKDLTSVDFDRAYVPPEILDIVREAFASAGRIDLEEERVTAEKPFIETFSPAVAMFGGVSPSLNRADIERLRSVLIKTSGGSDGEKLALLVSDFKGTSGLRPHEEGYELAEEVLEALGKPGNEDFVDVLAICKDLTVQLLEYSLDTDTIRGVALAGVGFSPTILINRNSSFNLNDLGCRFTIAHELCHVLFDRSRARRVAHVSGPWAAPGVEKRANAFAAYLLMPRSLLVRHITAATSPSPDVVTKVANTLRVNESALIEHLYNMDMIDEVNRERLRAAFRRH